MKCVQKRRVIQAVSKAIVAWALVMPVSVYAHSSERGLVMLLPTGYYLTGAAVAVAASFLLLSVVRAAWLSRTSEARLRLFSIPVIPPCFTSWLSFCVLLVLLFAGYTASTDPLANPLPLFIWTLWWVAFTLLQFVVGNLWHYFNVWTGPLHLLRRLTGIDKPICALPDKLGYSLAIVLFFAFAWFELIDLAPEHPERLATVVAVYWAINFIGMIVFGEKSWMERVEPFSIFFRLVGSCSPLVREGGTNAGGNHVTTIYLAWPGQSCLSLKPLPVSGVFFVLLTLSAVSFDGFAKTFIWLGMIGINPLEFPGRSVVQLENTIGLIAFFLLLSALFFGSIFFGGKLSNVSPKMNESWVSAAGRLVYSIIPISIVFHLAHYLTVLLVNGQYAVLAFNDPFNQGWNLFGLDGWHVTASFLTNIHTVSVIWTFQTIAIATGHIIGIVIAHLIALDIFQSSRDVKKTASLSQLFLAGLMVGYTVFGLWLLSTPSIG